MKQCFHGFALLGSSDQAFRAIPIQNHSGAIMIYSNSIDPWSHYNISIIAKLVSIFFSRGGEKR
jgi:hypothetical protein